MKPRRLIIAFAAGFIFAAALATILGAVIARLSEESRALNLASDVHHPLHLALVSIEESAKRGDCEKAAAQLRVLNQRLDEYRSGGPTPANWWQEVTTTTQPAH